MTDRSVLVYNPGLHVLGGGERYTLALAEALASDWKVRVGGVTVPPSELLAERGFPTGLEIVALPYREFPHESAHYSLAVAIQIYPPSYASRASRSAMAVQFPFRAPLGVRHPRASFKEHRALRSYDMFVSNSQFTRRWVSRRWHRESEILYPPADLGRYDEAAKKP